MKMLILLLAMTTGAMAQTDSPYTEQEAIEERRLSDEDKRNSMTSEEFDAYDQYINYIMLQHNDELEWEFIDNCLTYTDLVCEFEE
jgi:hypothetical protein